MSKMPTQYDPRDHIQPLAIAPRADGILDQREITIQSYQTTVPFDFQTVDAGLEQAWLTPVIRFGVFSRNRGAATDQCTVILGLQDDLSIRAYDYDARRPLWYSWRDVVVETISVHYFRDEDGLLRFKTTGGGRRITDDRLCEFNATFLRIPKEAVTKRSFDLDKVRSMCFGRFSDQLYTVRFADPSGQEYRSIDHAQFQSRQYIDPEAERFKEVRSDPKVTIESFDSDIEVTAPDLASPLKARFFLRGLSGSLRLRFPTIRYKQQVSTVEEQVRLFYRVVDICENLILDADYYARMPRSLDELDAECGLFPDNVDLAKFREVLLSAPMRQEFFERVDLNDVWHKWQPHLRAIDELLPTAAVSEHVASLLHDLTGRAPRQAAGLLTACLADAKMHRVGDMVTTVLTHHLHTIPANDRACVEASLLSWALKMEKDTWGVDPDSDEIGVFNVRWTRSDLSLDILPTVLAKLLGLLHSRLVATSGDMSERLRCMNWCVSVARAIPSNLPQLHPALRLIAENKTPGSVTDAAKVLRQPVADLQSLDEAVLDQFALPLWPYITASRENGKVTLLNSGLGVARALQPVGPVGLFTTPVDLMPGQAVETEAPGRSSSMNVEFAKYGALRQISVPIKAVAAPMSDGDLPSADGIFGRTRLVWQGVEHVVDLTEREARFLRETWNSDEVRLDQMIHPRDGLIALARFNNSRQKRNQVSRFLKELNHKLSFNSTPRVPFTFFLPIRSDAVVCQRDE